MNYHIEIHTKDNQVEHYIIQGAGSEAEARIHLNEYFERRKLFLAPTLQMALDDVRYDYYIFTVKELEEDRPVVYISGEYRSQYPL